MRGNYVTLRGTWERGRTTPYDVAYFRRRLSDGLTPGLALVKSASFTVRRPGGHDAVAQGGTFSAEVFVPTLTASSSERRLSGKVNSPPG